MKKKQLTNREKYLKKLNKYRKDGWEKPVLPYGIPFRDEVKTDSELLHHIWKIEKYRSEVIEDRWLTILKLAGIILFICIFIFR